MKLSELKSYELDDKMIKEIFFNIKKENYDIADYVVIYGCHIKQLLDERLSYSLKVLSKHSYDKIILTGGIGKKGNFNESEYMLNYLINHSIDKNKIIIENQSTTTEENNINILNMLGLNKVNKKLNIVLISQEPHLLRIMLHWRKIMENKNVNFYYDYVDDSILSYDKVVKNINYKKILEEQFEKTKKFILEDKYIDMEVLK